MLFLAFFCPPITACFLEEINFPYYAVLPNLFVALPSKQCNSFKTRANQVKEGLEKGVSDITVLLNPNKVCLVNVCLFVFFFFSVVALNLPFS
jgi:hypothetical protein